MITVGYGSSSGGGGGVNLWQLIGSAPNPDDIELNTGAGVTGIVANLPGTSFDLVHSNMLAGFPVSGWLYQDNTSGHKVFVGIDGETNPPTAIMQAEDLSNGFNAEVTMQPNGVLRLLLTLPSAEQILVKLDGQNCTIGNAAGTIFQISNTGQIETNQVTGGAPVAVLPTKKLAVYNEAGVFQGYVPVFAS